MSHKILVINPGSTSTKIGVFEDEKLLFDKTLRHSAEEIAQFPTIADQKDFRKKLVLEALAENHFDMKELSAVCGRGGLMKSIPGGTYQVTTSIVVDLVKGVQGQHASNLGGILAREIADVTISAGDLYSLVTLRELGMKLMGRIHGNYRFIIGFNLAWHQP